jgi:predicted PurR-regulated permease PerM
MARSETTSANHKLLTLVTIVVAVAGLRLAREVLIPLALAILFSFLLAPLVRRIERLGLWRIPSVLLVTVLAMTAVIGTGYILAGQLVDLSDSLPQYRSAIRERAYLIRSGASAALGRASENIRELSKDLATTQAAPTSVPAVATQPPVPVQVVDYSGQPLEWIQTALGSLLSPILTAGVVAIFVFFILLQREDLRDRLIRLAGQERVDVTTQALDDTARRISRYLLMQATVNTCLGLLVAAGLWLIGIPNAVLWGMMATALRFIPYVGIWIAAAGPMILSLAVFSGWMAPVAVVGLYIGLEILVANFIEPLVYGGSTGLSPLAVLVAAIFWAWLWGPVGLLLSTPLTVCMVVLGKYTPTLSFLTVLLGDQRCGSISGCWPATRKTPRISPRIVSMTSRSPVSTIRSSCRVCGWWRWTATAGGWRTAGYWPSTRRSGRSSRTSMIARGRSAPFLPCPLRRRHPFRPVPLHPMPRGRPPSCACRPAMKPTRRSPRCSRRCWALPVARVACCR